jgi:hypothetical protein
MLLEDGGNLDPSLLVLEKDLTEVCEGLVSAFFSSSAYFSNI